MGGNWGRPPPVPCCPQTSRCHCSLAMPHVVAQAMLRQRVAQGGTSGPPLSIQAGDLQGPDPMSMGWWREPIPSPPCCPPPPRAQLLEQNRRITGCQTVRPQGWGPPRANGEGRHRTVLLTTPPSTAGARARRGAHRPACAESCRIGSGPGPGSLVRAEGQGSSARPGSALYSRSPARGSAASGSV